MSWSDHILDAAFRRNRWELLVGGLLLGVAAHGAWGVALLAWLAPVPWLHYLRENPDRRALVWFFAMQTVMWLLVAAKGLFGHASRGHDHAGAAIWDQVMGAAVVIAMAQVLWRRIARYLLHHLAVLAFPLLMLVADGTARALFPATATLLLPLGNDTGTETFLMGLAVGEAGAMFLLRWLPAALEANWETVYPVAMRRHLVMAALAVVAALVVGRVLDVTMIPAGAAPSASGPDPIPSSPWTPLVALLAIGALFIVEALERRAAMRAAERGMIDPW